MKNVMKFVMMGFMIAGCSANAQAACQPLVLVNQGYAMDAYPNSTQVSLTFSDDAFGNEHIRSDLNVGIDPAGLCMPTTSGVNIGGADLVVGALREHSGGSLDFNADPWVLSAPVNMKNFSIQANFNFNITNTRKTGGCNRKNCQVCLRPVIEDWTAPPSLGGVMRDSARTYGNVCQFVFPGETKTFTQGNPNAFNPAMNGGKGIPLGDFFRAYIVTDGPVPKGMVLGGKIGDVTMPIGNNYSVEPLN